MEFREFVSNDRNKGAWIALTIDRLERLNSAPLVIHSKNGHYICGSLTPVRALLETKIYHKKHDLEKALLYDCFREAETNVPGSAAFINKFLVNSEKDLQLLSKRKMPFEEYRDIVFSMVANRETKVILKNALDVLSADSRISVKKHKKMRTVISIREGQKLVCRMDPLFEKTVQSSGLSMDYAKVLLIDGSISSVSEINSMLEKFSESLESCLLFCKSFNEEVSNTLAVNWLKNKLRIIPIVYGNEISSINLPADLCSISGALPISSNMGDVISMAVLDESRFGQLTSVNLGSHWVLCNATCDHQKHMNNIITRISKETQEDKLEILSERLTNLSGNILEISIPDHKPYIYEELDSSINVLNEFLKHGAAEVKGIGNVPYSIYINCNSVSQSFKNNISSIGGYLVKP